MLEELHSCTGFGENVTLKNNKSYLQSRQRIFPNKKIKIEQPKFRIGITQKIIRICQSRCYLLSKNC